ncbi:MAG: hypothetical protein IPG08_12050 [Sphingobacteriaceae bacterium]|nr:hypothetical protein [Sphingobacteriaceae bacterium]
MRAINSLLVFAIASLLLPSCGEKSEPNLTVKKKFIEGSNSYELLMFDTINKIDLNGLKQGKWIVRKLPGNIVLESGMYKDNQKQGCWVRHGLKGEFIDSIYYNNDVPSK